MEWSSPVRRSHDGQALSALPNEIYLDIFGYIKSDSMGNLNDDPPAKRSLRSLSLVCRFFCATIAPWLFHSMCFDADLSTPAEIPSTSQFCRKLLAGDENARLMAQFVKKCEFLSWTSDVLEHNWMSKEFLAIYAESLLHMPNIEELYLTTTTITKGLLRSISKLQKLSSLTIRCCTVASGVKFKHLQKLSSLKLRHVSFASQNLDSISHHLNLDSTLYLRLYNWPTSSQLQGQVDSLPLETLDVFKLRTEDVPQFGTFLSRVPRLKSLRIDYLPEDNSQLKVNSHSVPQLSTVIGPSYLVDIFAPGRSLTSVETPVIDENCLKGLQDSACPISRVSTSLRSYCDIPLWKYLPELDVLEAKFVTPPNSLTETLQKIDCFISSCPKHPKVKFLHIGGVDHSYGAWDVLCQRQVLLRLLPSFPTLRRFSYGNFVQWTDAQSNGKWEPELIAEGLDIFLMLDNLDNVNNFTSFPGHYSRLVAFRKEVNPNDYAILVSRHARRTDASGVFFE